MRRVAIAVLAGAMLAWGLAATCPAQAQSRHALSISQTQNIGGFFSVVVRSLDSRWDLGHDKRFILHTMWIADDTESWIEAGFVDGSVQVPGANQPFYHHGFYYALGRWQGGKVSRYGEYPYYGPSTDPGTRHGFVIKREEEGGVWGVYLDRTLARRVKGLKPTAARMDVGLETNYYGSVSSHWYEEAFSLLYQDGSWSYWKGGQLNLSEAARAWGMGVKWVTPPRQDGLISPMIQTWKQPL
ncbi:MAG: hypothetical protein K6T75_05505 [Acetobacteraceae bacterium]|nr:hypothetical protein [Acetobacteraceae bacterium]